MAFQSLDVRSSLSVSILLPQLLGRPEAFTASISRAVFNCRQEPIQPSLQHQEWLEILRVHRALSMAFRGILKTWVFYEPIRYYFTSSAVKLWNAFQNMNQGWIAPSPVFEFFDL